MTTKELRFMYPDPTSSEKLLIDRYELLEKDRDQLKDLAEKIFARTLERENTRLRSVMEEIAQKIGSTHAADLARKALENHEA